MNRFLILRFLLLPMILIILCISVFFTIRGMWICWMVLTQMSDGSLSFHLFTSQSNQEPTALIIMEAVDSFLLSFVFFIFSFGLYKIFFVTDHQESMQKLPAWLNIHSILELKALLWQSILTTLVMLFLNYAASQLAHKTLSVDILLLPGSILIIALALYFMKMSEKQ